MQDEAWVQEAGAISPARKPPAASSPASLDAPAPLNTGSDAPAEADHQMGQEQEEAHVPQTPLVSLEGVRGRRSRR
jgi:hypothetical protein